MTVLLLVNGNEYQDMLLNIVAVEFLITVDNVFGQLFIFLMKAFFSVMDSNKGAASSSSEEAKEDPAQWWSGWKTDLIISACWKLLSKFVLLHGMRTNNDTLVSRTQYILATGDTKLCPVTFSLSHAQDSADATTPKSSCKNLLSCFKWNHSSHATSRVLLLVSIIISIVYIVTTITAIVFAGICV